MDRSTAEGSKFRIACGVGDELTSAVMREMTQEDCDWIGTVWSLARRPPYHGVSLEGRPGEGCTGDADIDEIDRLFAKRADKSGIVVYAW